MTLFDGGVKVFFFTAASAINDVLEMMLGTAAASRGEYTTVPKLSHRKPIFWPGAHRSRSHPSPWRSEKARWSAAPAIH